MSVPPSASVIDPSLIQAYRETEYRVFGTHSIVLRIDAVSADLARLHRALKVDGSAFITACNPCSQASTAAINIERQALLAAELVVRGLTAIDAIGIDPSGRWQGEPSFFVPGMTLQDAKETGCRYAQNAVVWSGSDAIPRLILLR